MYLHWVFQFRLLSRWAGSCEVTYFPGDNPDAALIDKAAYEAQLARRCKRVYAYLSNSQFYVNFHVGKLVLSDGGLISLTLFKLRYYEVIK